MAARPLEDPTWATSAVNVTTPGAGQRVSGWLPDDIPAPNVWNWHQYFTGLHVVYLEQQRWRDVALDRFVGVSGAPTFNGNDWGLTLPTGAGVQIAIPVHEFEQIDRLRFRHTDGATGVLTVQAGRGTSTGGGAVINVVPLTAPVAFANTATFVWDFDDFGATPYVGTEEDLLLISLSNSGVTDVLVHKISRIRDLI